MRKPTDQLAFPNGWSAACGPLRKGVVLSADYLDKHITLRDSAPHVRIKEGLAFVAAAGGLRPSDIARIASAASANEQATRQLANLLPLEEGAWTSVREIVCFRLENHRPWEEAIAPFTQATGFSADLSWYLAQNALRYGEEDELVEKIARQMSAYEDKPSAPRLPDYLPCASLLRGPAGDLRWYLWKLDYAERSKVEPGGVIRYPA